MTKSRHMIAPRRRWSADELSTLRLRYPTEPTARIAEQLGRRRETVYAMAAGLGLKKSPEYLASPHACRLRRGDNVGAAFRFKKGQAPANKGLRRPGWHAGRMRETQFKKGQLPHNWRYPIGSTRLVDGYLYEKVREASPWTKAWRQAHYLLWERAGRSIPAGHALVFKDGDRRNITLDNLDLVTRAELMRRNTVHRLPKPLVQVIHLTGVVRAQITRRKKREQQDRRPA